MAAAWYSHAQLPEKSMQPFIYYTTSSSEIWVNEIDLASIKRQLYINSLLHASELPIDREILYCILLPLIYFNSIMC